MDKYPKTIRYLVEGVWNGYRSGQERVCHRDLALNKDHADKIKKLHSIQFTDGTFLHLTVRPLKLREKFAKINGYGSLISDCLYYKVSSVSELNELKNKNKGVE